MPISAVQEMKAWRVKTGDIPLSARIERDFGVHQLYGLDSFTGEDTSAFAQGFQQLADMRGAAAERARLRTLGSMSPMFDYQSDIRTSLPGDTSLRKAREEETARINREAVATEIFYRAMSEGDYDTAQAMIREYGALQKVYDAKTGVNWLESVHAKEGLQQTYFLDKASNDQMQAVRNAYWEANLKNFVETEEYYRNALALYLYNAGCTIMALITAELMNSKRGPLEDFEKEQVFDALYSMLKEGKLLRVPGVSPADEKSLSKGVYQDMLKYASADRYKAGESFELKDNAGMVKRALVDTGILGGLSGKSDYKAVGPVNGHWFVIDKAGNIVFDPMRGRLKRKSGAYENYKMDKINSYLDNTGFSPAPEAPVARQSLYELMPKPAQPPVQPAAEPNKSKIPVFGNNIFFGGLK